MPKFILDVSHTEPVRCGRLDDGWVVVQVQANVVWIGRTYAGLVASSNIAGGSDILRDGFELGPGLYYLPWSGDLWMYAPSAETATVYGTYALMGCVDA